MKTFEPGFDTLRVKKIVGSIFLCRRFAPIFIGWGIALKRSTEWQGYVDHKKVVMLLVNSTVSEFLTVRKLLEFELATHNAV